MADTEIKQQIEPPEEKVDENDERSLNYLRFVQVAVIYLAICISSLYEIAKENAGPLKPGVQAVEATVKTVMAPIYDKFHDIPFQLLKYLDRKVEEAIGELEKHVPSLLKDVATEVQQAGGVVNAAKSVATGVRERCESAAIEMYKKYEPVAEQYVAAAWRMLNQLPLFPEVADVVLPLAAYWAEMYNQAVCYGEERGYELAHYLPLIPVERIARVLEQGGEETEPEVTHDGGKVLTAQ